MSIDEFRTDRVATLARTSISRVLWILFALALGLVFIVPVSMIVIGAFRDGLPSQNNPFTLDGIKEALTSDDIWSTLRDSLILVVVCGSIATIVGGFFAWVSANTNVPLRRLLTPLMIINLFVPPLFHTFAWIMLGNAQNGLINQFTRSLGLGGPLDIQSWFGLIFTMSLGFVPFAFLLMRGAFLNRDQSLDEAASISGASTVRTFFTVTVPSIAPAITGAAILIMVLIFQAFEGPQLLGRPAGIYVFSTQIYHYIRDVTPSKYTAAFTLSLVVVLLVVILFLVQHRLLKGRTFTTLTGKTSRREPLQLGPVRWVFSGLIAVFTVVNLALPLFAVVLGSLQPIFGVSGRLSFDNYSRILHDPSLSSSLSLTAWVAIVGGLCSMTVAVLTTYVVMRRRGFVRAFTSLSLWVPWALPGIVLALAYLFTILTVPGLKGLYGTSTFMMIVLIIATIPLCTRLAEGALAQLAPELEEAGRISGSSSMRVLVTIVLRLVIPSFLAGWFLAALFISGNLAIPTLLAPPKVQPVSQVAFQLFLSGDISTAAALFMIILAAAVVVIGLAGISIAVGRRLQNRPPTQSELELVQGVSLSG
ncbi:ABC transporter permease [Rhodococcoides yunnanense]|uniref:ABC transporter permease n=1 Tax=Rhodococcoides yunnanense TaxID=278209 RepID=UPI001C3F5E4C|nr:iron ABC transporter permease [Rhodococcus yunnanensis]